MWLKKNEAVTGFESYVKLESGKTLYDLTHTEDVLYETGRLQDAADMVRKAVSDKRFIYVATDYDADGINSAAEMYMILQKMGVPNSLMKVIIPRRMSDGYGIGEGLLQKAPDGCLLITIDNGIAAVDPIKHAKERGMDVLVLDHHLRGADGMLPPADLIIDPEDDAAGWTFNGYCGAGLTFKLAELLFPDDEDFLDRLSVFAAIATVGDLVNVTGDNRNIILRGIYNLNERRGVEAVSEILEVLIKEKSIEHFGCEEIAFNIAPMFNAPGRLMDDGGMKVLQGLFYTGMDAVNFARWLYAVNDQRKNIVAARTSTVHAFGKNVAICYMQDFPEGVCGIMAAKVCEKTRKPSFVMTDSALEPGTLKGSARSPEGVNVFEIMKSAGPLFTKCGGHAEAAGFSLKTENFYPLIAALDNAAPPPMPAAQEYFDFAVHMDDLSFIYEMQERIGAFGVGLRKPVIKTYVTARELKLIGQTKNTVSFKCADIRFVGFSMASQYANLSDRNQFFVYGQLEEHRYLGKISMQFRFSGMSDK